MEPNEARRVLVEELDWPEWMVDLGIRAGFCCEYCGRYLLEDVDAYDGWQKDHVVPEDNDEMSNLAIACRTCNFIKRHTDPRRSASNHDRESLVTVAAQIVQERRERKREIWQKTRNAVDAIMQGDSAGKST